MKKLFLLLGILPFSMANAATCTPPTTLKCNCAHPIINSAGELACGPTYCETGTKCMPNGACCLEANYCESTEQGKQCCSDEQTCDEIKGCVESCIIDCTNQKTGTKCCTSSGIAGLCLNNTCQTQTCVGDEQLYVGGPFYYNEYKWNYNSTYSIRCCTNNPNEEVAYTFKAVYCRDPEENYEKKGLCCPDGTSSYIKEILYECDVKVLYACFEKKPRPTFCAYGCNMSNVDTLTPDNIHEVNDGAANIAFEYCPNGYTDWTKDDIGWRRDCL